MAFPSRKEGREREKKITRMCRVCVRARARVCVCMCGARARACAVRQ